MDFRAQISALISAMLADAAAAGIDRYEVAAQASRLAGRDVSKAMLDGYTSEAREEFNAPLWLAPILEIVCKSTALSEWHVSILGGCAKFGIATIDAEIGRLEHERDIAGQRARDLKALRRRHR